jgi:hypothetical protein
MFCDKFWQARICPIPGQNLTKMFHVKHFCPVGAENLTRPLTCGGFR